MTKFPFWTCGITGLSVVIYLTPSLTEQFIYDGNAIIAGEWWRMILCHLVHYSPSHLFYNGIVFFIVGIWIEKRIPSLFGTLCLIMALSISLVLLIFKPEVIYYAGLSGIACGAVVFCLLFEALKQANRWRTIYLAILLLLVAGKLFFEIITGQNLFVTIDSEIKPVFVTHFVGAVVATVFFFGIRKKQQASLRVLLPGK